ncbi:hypothetical protein [Bacteroides bouchesdurhonensis]
MHGSRGFYSVMEGAKVIHLKTILNGSPLGMKFIGYKIVDEFNHISYIECTREVTVYEDEYGIYRDYYCPLNPQDERPVQDECCK